MSSSECLTPFIKGNEWLSAGCEVGVEGQCFNCGLMALHKLLLS
jgi:hypothetical protein